MSLNQGAIMTAEAVARGKEAASRASVHEACVKKVTARTQSCAARLADAEAMRQTAARLRQEALDHLGHYLELAERRMTENGMTVHWAENAEQAREIIARICREAGAEEVIKSKSMVSEEIELNEHLNSIKIKPLETDLGEFIVQLDGDRPSHIVTPIIHKSRLDVARTFAREGLGEYTEDAEALTRQARRRMRRSFESAVVGLTGANFIAADTGRLVCVSNEGNLRMCATAPRVHIALTGIEKVLAREADLGVLLKLLARSSTGQDLTVYTQFIGGPRKAGNPDGPEAVHVILLDNGRSEVLNGPCAEILRCIRCGACLNVCPVYRTVTGHAYSGVYNGPMGAVLGPLLAGAPGHAPGHEVDAARKGEMARASSLCGACEEVCPVAIPIPKLLLRLRAQMHEGGGAAAAAAPWGAWSALATRPALWRVALRGGRAFGWGLPRLLPGTPFSKWLQDRELPRWPRKSFRESWRELGRPVSPKPALAAAGERTNAGFGKAGLHDSPKPALAAAGERTNAGFGKAGLHDSPTGARERILGRVASAAKPHASAPAQSDAPPPEVARQIAANEQPEKLRAMFGERLRELGDTLIECADWRAACGWIEADVTRHALATGIVDPDALAALGLVSPCAFGGATLTAAGSRDDAFAAAFGIGLVDAAIAETGTLVIASGPGRMRLTSLAPEVHYALVRARDLVPDLIDAMAWQSRQPAGCTVTWITGSSRTADIGGELIHGAHGPARLVVILVEND